MKRLLPLLFGILGAASVAAAPRARDLGVPFEGIPGSLNAITDVAGVSVGQVTLIEDLDDGRKVRTGVTAVLPRGRESIKANVYGGWFALNGNGEMTGTAWIDESGSVEGPVMITNTHSVGVVRDTVIAWRVKARPADASGYYWSLPIVAETWDGHLNDINGFHVRPEHVFRALDTAATGPVAEGNVGGGTGMICHEFKCGIGTASRAGEDRRQRIHAGRAGAGELRCARFAAHRRRARGAAHPQRSRLHRPAARPGRDGFDHRRDRHRCAVAAAPVETPRAPGRDGTRSHGQLRGQWIGRHFYRFFDRERGGVAGRHDVQSTSIDNEHIDPLFVATVQGTEESIVNAMVAARDMQGNERALRESHSARRTRAPAGTVRAPGQGRAAALTSRVVGFCNASSSARAQQSIASSTSATLYRQRRHEAHRAHAARQQQQAVVERARHDRVAQLARRRRSASVSTSSIPIISPLPRTSPMHAWRAVSSRSRRMK